MNTALRDYLKGKEVKTVKLDNGGEAKVVEHNGRRIVVAASYARGPLLDSKNLTPTTA